MQGRKSSIKMQEEELKIAKNAKGITQNQMLNKLASNRSQSPYQEAKASLTTYRCEKCPKTFINSVAFGSHKRGHEREVIFPKHSRGAKALEAALSKKECAKEKPMKHQKNGIQTNLRTK